VNRSTVVLYINIIPYFILRSQNCSLNSLKFVSECIIIILIYPFNLSPLTARTSGGCGGRGRHPVGLPARACGERVQPPEPDIPGLLVEERSD